MNFSVKYSFSKDHEQLKSLLIEKISSEDKWVAELKSKTQRILILEELVRYLKHSKFGCSSEKLDDRQNDLFNEAEELAELESEIDE